MLRRPTIEEYRAEGRDYYIVCNTCTHLYVRLANIFGMKPLEPLRQIEVRINNVRSCLDDKVYDDYPLMNAQESCRIYYAIRGIEFEQLDDIPEELRHKKLTFDQYKQIGDELKKLKKSVVSLGLKSAKLHGKTKVRGVLDSSEIFTKLFNNLQLIEYKDLSTQSIAKTDLFNVFWGDL